MDIEAGSQVRNFEVKFGVLMGFDESSDVHMIKYLNK